MGNLAQRPPLGQKQGKPICGTRAGLLHMRRVKALPCVLCRNPEVEVHHCRSAGQMRDDFKTIPLCLNHHRGPDGFHTQKGTWEAQHGLDTDFLPVVADMLAGQFNWGRDAI